MAFSISDRRKIAAETMSYFKKLLGAVPDKLIPAIRATRFFESMEPLPPLPEAERKRTLYRGHRADTVDTACKLKREGLNPLVLNLASELSPGGGWSNGAFAQEECIFIRSTYDLSLNSRHNLDPGRKWRYPIPLLGGIYSPDVLIFRGGKNERYRIWNHKDFVYLDFVAVAALRRPKLTPTGRFTDHDAGITKEKMRTILRIAWVTGHSTLLLGGIGCGVFRNPPRHVAELFKAVFNEEEFLGRFDQIHFAILDSSREANYEIFKDVLQ
jgi:uncharacterized protein (TIGR02452 family)